MNSLLTPSAPLIVISLRIAFNKTFKYLCPYIATDINAKLK